ncbi:MAG TPA: hypothetical protein VMK84_13785 [Streptosporangiaceae bacterium]|nr:hypothetical protein [Streptosporangiaceae bacterium]
MVALEATALSLAKTILQKAAGAWISDRRTAEERKKELRALLTPWFRQESPEQRFLDEAASDLKSFGQHEFRGLDDGERAAGLFAVYNAFEREGLTDRALFAVDVDAAKLARRLRDGQPGAKTDAGLGEAGSAFYDAALDRCSELYVRAVQQVPAFVGRSLAEMLGRLSDLSEQVADGFSSLPGQVVAGIAAWQEAQAAIADPDGDVRVAGRPLEEVTNPFDLEVHRPVQLEDAPPGLPVLPLYEEREHDEVLRQVVRAAAHGRSGIAVLVGESSTGKTRACWEALDPLRDQDPPWRLWHPIDPSPPDAALRELRGIGPRTVVWLNEAQLYLDTVDERGEQVAAGLRALLRDPARGPVLVLATLWPEYWHSLTARPAPAGGKDRHAQARELLADHDITLPAAFTSAQMGRLAGSGDARLELAARSAPDGQVIQFLAGAPELLARYRNAPPAAAALISAAMDARRLGMGVGLPHAFLEAAAPGYLTGDQWDALGEGEDWLEQPLAYAAVPAKGARGPLTRIRPRPAASRAARSGPRDSGEQLAGGPGGIPGGPLYRLADYLDQYGRQHRKGQFPPPEFWFAAAAHAPPADQAALGAAAHDRGLYRDAAQLHKNAAAAGSLSSALYLTQPPACLRADPGPAHWVAAHVSLDNPYGVAALLRILREAGAAEQATALASRAAAHVPLEDPGGVADLLYELREAGAAEQAAALLARDPAAHARLDDPEGVGHLLDRLREAGAAEQAAALLAGNPAAHAPLDDPRGVGFLLAGLREAGAAEQAAALGSRAAAHAPLDNPGSVAFLLWRSRVAGAAEQAAALLAGDPAAHVSLDDSNGVGFLLDMLRDAGAAEQAAALADRTPGVGMFELFLRQEGLASKFRFGREADGTPAAPWGWEDLDLLLGLRQRG